MTQLAMDGFLNLHKEIGLTSHDCVARVRKLLRLKRVGHGGTLDPAATGVLPIALGRATRLLQFLRSDKAYQATIRFGMRTTTDDLEGEVIHAAPVPYLELAAIEAVLPQFLGKIQQIPPSYSAIQIQGQRLYDLARAGQAVVAPPRSVEIFDIQILDWRSGDFPELVLAIACGSGTYIRSIARDLGEILQTGATLAGLVRTQSCGLPLSDSLTLDALAAQLQAGEFQLIAPTVVLQHLQSITLPEPLAKRWCQGQRIIVAWEDNRGDIVPDCLRVYEGDRFLGIGQLTQSEEQTLLIPQMVFAA